MNTSLFVLLSLSSVLSYRLEREHFQKNEVFEYKFSFSVKEENPLKKIEWFRGNDSLGSFLDFPSNKINILEFIFNLKCFFDETKYKVTITSISEQEVTRSFNFFEESCDELFEPEVFLHSKYVFTQIGNDPVIQCRGPTISNWLNLNSPRKTILPNGDLLIRNVSFFEDSLSSEGNGQYECENKGKNFTTTLYTFLIE